MWALSILLLLGCGEWALIFRTWVSFRYLILYAGAAFLRLFYLPHFFPHWDTYYFLLPVAVLAAVYHLRSLWRANTSHNQQTYDTPETGVPWLVLIARNPKRAVCLEIAIIFLSIYYLIDSGNLIRPPGFGTLPPGLQEWLETGSHAGIFAFLFALATPFAYMTWHQAVSGVPFWPERKPKVRPSSTNRHVRVQNHALPELPNVKELSDNLE